MSSGPLKIVLRIVAAVIPVLIAVRCFVAVDETEYVLVTRFGNPVRTIREPGAHLIMPYHSVMRFDRRLQLYDPKPSEFLTADPKNILLDVYVCWRIEEPLTFLGRMTDKAGAEARLHDVVWGELAAEIGRRPLAGLVSDKPGEMVADEIMGGVLERCRESLGDAAGVELVDVRLKRVNLPEQNKQSVFDRMRAERDRIARLYRAEGEEEALKIRADADLLKSRILAEARRDAEIRRGEAAGEAIGIYAAAHGEDPEFYRFLRSLEAYKIVLRDRTTMVLSADSDFFRYLADPEGAAPPDALRLPSAIHAEEHAPGHASPGER